MGRAWQIWRCNAFMASLRWQGRSKEELGLRWRQKVLRQGRSSKRCRASSREQRERRARWGQRRKQRRQLVMTRKENSLKEQWRALRKVINRQHRLEQRSLKQKIQLLLSKTRMRARPKAPRSKLYQLSTTPSKCQLPTPHMLQHRMHVMLMLMIPTSFC